MTRRWLDAGLAAAAAMVPVLALLGPLAVLAVLRGPALASPARLGAGSVGVATGIELLQWALPLGRVVSPMDAALNSVGALLAGGAAAALATPARGAS